MALDGKAIEDFNHIFYDFARAGKLKWLEDSLSKPSTSEQIEYVTTVLSDFDKRTLRAITKINYFTIQLNILKKAADDFPMDEILDGFSYSKSDFPDSKILESPGLKAIIKAYNESTLYERVNSQYFLERV